jgi:hypothetical protein
MTNNELLKIRKQLEDLQGLRVDLRGSGKAAFLYVRSPKRAAEVSLEGDEYFLEYWNEADEGSEKAAVKNETVQSSSEAIKKLTEWLVVTMP